MKSSFFKYLYKIHIYLGLFVAVHLVILTLTGAVLLFKDELSGEAAESHASADSAAPVSVQEQLQKAITKYPGERPLAYSIEEEDSRIAQLRMGKDNSKEFRGARRVYIDTTTGEEIAPLKQDGKGFWDWLLRLHRELLLGSSGKIYVGIIGLLYAFVLCSGFYIYGNFGKKTSYGEIRTQSKRSVVSDLHRFLGITTFAWGLVIAITGLFLGLSSTLIKVYQYRELKKLSIQYPTAPNSKIASLDKVLATAHAALPQSTFSYLAFPDTQFSPPGHFLVLMHGNTPLTEKLVELVVVDGVSGELTQVRSLPWYLKVSMLSEPLHFGNYGGLTLKIIWLALALISLSLPVFGIVIWYYRRRKKAAPVSAKASVRPWVSGIYQHPYLVPALISVMTITCLLGSFLAQGVLNQLFAVLLVIPVFYCLRGLYSLLKGLK